MKRTQSDQESRECNAGEHQACTGYTDDWSDPELCFCACHDDDEATR